MTTEALNGDMVSQMGFSQPLYLLLLVPLLAYLIWYVRKGGWSRKKLVFLAVRTLMVVLAVLALASPVTYRSREVVEDVPPVTVLVDSSASMGMYSGSRELGQLLYSELQSAVGNLSDESEVNIEYFSEGNRTALGDALYNNMIKYGGEQTSVVLVSDGRSNHGRNPLDIARAMAETNSTVYAVAPDKGGEDIYINSVIGDGKIPSNIDYDLTVVVGSTGARGASYELLVYVDDIRKFNKRFTQEELEKTIQLSLRMQDVGVHEVRLELDASGDSFPENNAYYKTVEVVEKPEILVVTSNRSSPMLQVLNELYDVKVTGRVDNDYGQYAGVIFDNVNAKDLPRDRVNKIKKYVLDGNGVAFVGGRNTFEYGGYNNSFIEGILPVTSTDKPTERRRELAVAFLIDVSESTEYGIGEDSKIDVEKALLLRMLRTLNANDSVGVIAFNTLPYSVSQLSPLGPKFTEVEDRVLRLKFGGGTKLLPAMEAADSMLRGQTVDKYVIILSDGVIQGSRRVLNLNKAAEMRDRGVEIYAVGVGFDTDEGFMQELARSGGGQYFKSEPGERLKVVFGEAEDEKDADKTPVVLSDEYHFITRNLFELENAGASVQDFNKVYEKNVAQMLLSTKGGKPVLTVWRFGLGRVAALTTDNGLVWSPELMKVDSGRVVTGMTNWVIGDLEKGKAVRVNAPDVHLGDGVEVAVVSDSQPSLQVRNYETLEEPQVMLTRNGLMTYSGVFTPQSQGFYGVRAVASGEEDLDAAAVNYPREYNSLGVDEDTLMRVSGVTAGRMYSSDEVGAVVSDVLEKAREKAVKEFREPVDLWTYFAAAALIIYFLDAAARRIMVFLRRNQSSTQPT